MIVECSNKFINMLKLLNIMNYVKNNLLQETDVRSQIGRERQQVFGTITRRGNFR